MNLAQAPAALAIVAIAVMYNGATLYLYSGSIPATPETTATGTQLYSLTFASPAFPTSGLANGSGYDSLTAAFSSTGFVAAGIAGYGRAVIATPAARASSTSYGLGTLIIASSMLWVCVAPGTTGSSSTLTSAGYGVIDGTAAFNYVGASSVTVLADFTVGTTSAADIVLSSTTIQSSTTLGVSTLTLQVAAS